MSLLLTIISPLMKEEIFLFVNLYAGLYYPWAAELQPLVMLYSDPAIYTWYVPFTNRLSAIESLCKRLAQQDNHLILFARTCCWSTWSMELQFICWQGGGLIYICSHIFSGCVNSLLALTALRPITETLESLFEKTFTLFTTHICTNRMVPCIQLKLTSLEFLLDIYWNHLPGFTVFHHSSWI